MAEKNQEQRSALEEAAYHKLNRSVGVGTIVRIVGPVVDVKFDDQVPSVYTALTVEDMKLFARLTDTEIIVIDENTRL